MKKKFRKTRLPFGDKQLRVEFENMSRELYNLLDSKINDADFKEELKKAVPQTKVTGMRNSMVTHLKNGERELYRFLQKSLIPAVMLDSHGEQVPHEIELHYKTNCNDCNTISRHVIKVEAPVMDFELIKKIRTGEYDTSCTEGKRNCKSEKGYVIISSSNKFILSSASDFAHTGIYRVGGRIKRGPSLTDKFIRYLVDYKSVILDVIAGRVVAIDETKVEDVREKIAYLAKQNRSSLRGRTEYINFPLGKIKKLKQKYSAIHIDYPLHIHSDDKGGFDTVELQLRTTQSQKWCEEGHLHHKRYKQRAINYDKTDPKIITLAAYLGPIFGRYEL